MIDAERGRESEAMVGRLGRDKGLDLEAMEFYVRSQMLGAGAGALEAFLAGRLREEEAPECGENHPPRKMVLHDRRAKAIRTILGEVCYVRGRFVCPVCGAARYPADEALGVAATGFSPGARRLMARAGATEPFAQAAEALDLYASLRVGAKDVERIAERVGREVAAWAHRQSAWALARAGCAMRVVQEAPETLYVSFDGTGMPMRREELEGAKGKQGVPKTRETKLGCVFTQTGLDEKGRPVRDEGSTTYTGAIEASVEFGYRIHGEAVRRGLRQARRVAVVTDGAAYNKTIVQEHFAGAIAIIDLYHAREHLAEFAKDIAHIPLDSSWFKKARRTLDKGQIERLMAQMRDILPRSGPRRRAGLDQIRYFQTHAEQMRYGKFRRQKLFIGSGVIEAGSRTLVGARLKRSGMFWTRAGANAILALRCCLLSGRFEQFWEDAA